MNLVELQTSESQCAPVMASRETVYQCFGRAAELAQLLEMEVGTALLALDALESQRFLTPDSQAYLRLRGAIESQTLGQALRRMREKLQSIDDLELVFSEALRFRIRLSHRFFPDHGLSMLSDDGRLRMVTELIDMSSTLQRAYQLASDVAFALLRDVQQLDRTNDVVAYGGPVAVNTP